MHLETQHYIVRFFVLVDGDKEESKGCTFEARRDLDTGSWPCPVPNCPGGGRDPYDLRRHFRSRHPRDLVSVRGETLPRCEICGMQVSAAVLGSKRHEATWTCQTFCAMRTTKQPTACVTVGTALGDAGVVLTLNALHYPGPIWFSTQVLLQGLVT